MKIAIPTWQGRISPVLDVARRVLVVELEDAAERARTVEVLDETEPAARVRRLAVLGVDVLICGAISQHLESLLQAEGIRTIPQTCGDVEEVLRAFMDGRLLEPAFLMPGCRGHRRRCRHRRGRGRGPRGA
jgi:predicted Fe-Mo cluster-binding NifX family protein